MPRTLRVMIFLLGLTACLGTFENHLQAEEGTVTESGTAILEKQPDLLRMQIKIFAQDRTLRRALERLKLRLKKVQEEIAKVETKTSHIQVGEAEIASGKTDQQRQMERMIAQQLKQRGEDAKGEKKLKRPIQVAATVTVEWPLKAKSNEELLVESHLLKEQIEKIEFNNADELEQFTPEEQELLEEFGDGLFGFGDDDESDPKKPKFLFVGKITEEEWDSAMAKAFKKAQGKAARLARAAGMEIGKLVKLESESANDYTYLDVWQDLSSWAPSVLSNAGTENLSEDENREAVATEAKKVSYGLVVNATFSLKAAE